MPSGITAEQQQALTSYYNTLDKDALKKFQALPVEQQISIMIAKQGEKPITDNKPVGNSVMTFDSSDVDADMGLKVEHQVPSEEEVIPTDVETGTEVLSVGGVQAAQQLEEIGINPEDLTEEEKQLFTEYVIQNNTGWWQYAKMQGQARMASDLEYKKIDYEREIKILQENNPQYKKTGLIVGKIIKIEGEIATDKMKSTEQSRARYSQEQARLANERIKNYKPKGYMIQEGDSYDKIAKKSLKEDITDRELTSEEVRIRREEILAMNKGNRTFIIGQTINIPKSKADLKREEAQRKQQIQNNTINSLQRVHNFAQNSLKNQQDKDGWIGKSVDWISGAWNWNSGNRAECVQADIDKYKAEIEQLEVAKANGTFEQTFESIYGVKYNEVEIENFNRTATQFKEATTAEVVAVAVKSALGQHVSRFENKGGILEGYSETQIIPGHQVHDQWVPDMKHEVVHTAENVVYAFENDLKSLVGEDRFQQMFSDMGADYSNATPEDKYKMLGIYSKALISSTQEAEKKAKGDKTLEQIKTEYENAYKKAFGTENELQERVDEYARSQEIGVAAAKGVLVAGAVIAAGFTGGGSMGLLISAGTTFLTNAALDISDLAANNIDGDVQENLGKILKNSVVSGLMSGVTRSLAPFLSVPQKISNTVFREIIGRGENAVLEGVFNIADQFLKTGDVDLEAAGLVTASTFLLKHKNLPKNLESFKNPIKNTADIMRGSFKKTIIKYCSEADKAELDKYLNIVKLEIQNNKSQHPDLYALFEKEPELFEAVILSDLIAKNAVNPDKNVKKT